MSFNNIMFITGYRYVSFPEHEARAKPAKQEVTQEVARRVLRSGSSVQTPLQEVKPIDFPAIPTKTCNELEYSMNSYFVFLKRYVLAHQWKEVRAITTKFFDRTKEDPNKHFIHSQATADETGAVLSARLLSYECLGELKLLEKEAKEFLSQNIKYNPEIEGWIRIHLLYSLLNQGKHDEALSALKWFDEPHLISQKLQTTIKIARGKIYFATKNFSQAEKIYFSLLDHPNEYVSRIAFSQLFTICMVLEKDNSALVVRFKNKKFEKDQRDESFLFSFFEREAVNPEAWVEEFELANCKDPLQAFKKLIFLQKQRILSPLLRGRLFLQFLEIFERVEKEVSFQMNFKYPVTIFQECMDKNFHSFCEEFATHLSKSNVLPAKERDRWISYLFKALEVQGKYQEILDFSKNLDEAHIHANIDYFFKAARMLGKDVLFEKIAIRIKPSWKVVFLFLDCLYHQKKWASIELNMKKFWKSGEEPHEYLKLYRARSYAVQGKFRELSSLALSLARITESSKHYTEAQIPLILGYCQLGGWETAEYVAGQMFKSNPENPIFKDLHLFTQNRGGLIEESHFTNFEDPNALADYLEWMRHHLPPKEVERLESSASHLQRPTLKRSGKPKTASKMKRQKT